MTFLGILLLVLGARATMDADNEIYQTATGIIIVLMGFACIAAGETTWLDGLF